MPGKITSFSELIAQINTRDSWTKDQLAPLVNSLSSVVTPKLQLAVLNTLQRKKPEDLMINDIVVFNIMGLPHPAIIFNIDTTDEDPENHFVHAIVLSSTMGTHVLMQSESRQISKSYYTKTVVTIPYQLAKSTWRGVLEKPKELQNALKLLKKYLNKIL